MEPEDNSPGEPEEPEESRPSLAEALQSLPLLEDNMYLRMQALNLGVVDKLLEGLERQLLSEYIEQESTPIPTAMLVSATSQLWVFGVYELLRTWRQRARQVLRFAEEVSRLTREQLDARVAEQKARVLRLAANPRLANPAHWRAFERAATDPSSVTRLRSAMERSELPFRRLEALRVYLAKHEVPRVKGSYGTSPGYARINISTGSVYWQIDLGNMEVDVLSRREVADTLRELAIDFPCYILPEPVQRELAQLPAANYYNFRRVRLVLDDGGEQEALVAFNRQILGGPGFPELPYDVQRVVGCRPQSDPEPAA